MEAKHLVRLYAEYPAARSRAFLLSCVTPPGTTALEIRDPFGKAQTDYERFLLEVFMATSSLCEMLKRRRNPVEDCVGAVTLPIDPPS